MFRSRLFSNSSLSCGVRRGFTLMELVIVMLILIVISAMAMPTFMNYYREEQARQSTERLAKLFRFAHQESIFKRKPTTVGIDFETQTYFIRIQTGDREWEWEIKRSNQTPLPDGFKFEEIYYPDTDDEEDSEVAYVTFYPDGTSQTARLSITKFNEEEQVEKQFILRVNGVSGQVKVQEKRYDDGSYF